MHMYNLNFFLSYTWLILVKLYYGLVYSPSHPFDNCVSLSF